MELFSCCLEISVERTLAGVRRVAAVVTEALKGNVADKDLYQLELAFVEACTNAVKHGSPAPGNDRVRVQVKVDNNELEATVESHGERFDFESIARPSFDPERVETLPTGGMGVALIRDIMDEVTCSWEDGTNKLRMAVRLEGGEKVPADEQGESASPTSSPPTSSPDGREVL